jgi:PadR family transcriptional regulator, regulatory protein PadR
MEKCCHCDMKGFLSFIVLKMISKEDMSGDEIREEIKKRKGSKPSAGTIYPVLKSLKNSGMIEELKSNSKIKKYKLTKDGQKEVKIATKHFLNIFCDMGEEFLKN